MEFKKWMLGVAVAVSLVGASPLNTTASSNSSQLSQSEVMDILKVTPVYPRVAPLIKAGKIKVKGVKEGDFYILRLDTPRGVGNIYVTTDKKFTILGSVFNNATKKPLVGNFPVDKQVVEKGVMFTFGHGKKDIYLVTDPQCPFCRLMELKTGENLEKNYRVHVILLPLPFHRNARAMSYYILAGKTDQEKARRLKAILHGSNEWKNFKPTPAQKREFEEELKASQKAAVELGARGTPSVYDANFSPINWPTLIPKKSPNGEQK